MEFRILGSLEVWQSGRLIPVAGTKLRALLAVLLLHAGEVVSSDRLVDEIWGEDAPESGAAALRVNVSRLRRVLEDRDDVLATRAPGYVLRPEPGRFDLRRFERLSQDGETALARGDARVAAGLLHEALALWRGPPLADLTYASFAQGAIARLEELRLVALERRIEAELILGRHERLIGELQALVSEHPLRERLSGQLMLALYRDGRQAEALAAYRATRRRLVDDVGIEPGPQLRELERRILDQEDGLGLDAHSPATPRAILVLPSRHAAVDGLLRLAEPLAARAGHELIIAALVDDRERLAGASARLQAVRASLLERGASARVTAFTSADPAADAVRLAAEQDAALLVLDAPEGMLAAGRLDRALAGVLAGAVCDVALYVGEVRGRGCAEGGPVLVPFAGHGHDWAAVELGAWLAQARSCPLRLLGTRAGVRGRRDSSRLLAHASLALQRAVGVVAEPVLVSAGVDGILEAAEGAGVLVVGLSERWTREGLGGARLEIARRAGAPVAFVRRGVRPGGLAPAQALTHFTWSAVRD